MLLSLKGNFPPAILALADGTVFLGNSIGATGATTGEVVFNTAMTGYQEILTDPSYCQQIVTLTYPHIGNYGVNAEDVEADKIHAAGLIIKDLPLRGLQLPQDRDAERVPGARQHRRHRQHRHPQAHAPPAHEGRAERLHPRPGRRRGGHARPLIDKAIAAAKAAPSMAGLDLAKVVSVKRDLRMDADRVEAGHVDGKPGYGVQITPKFHVVAFDYGVKNNILRMIAERGARITVVPAQTPAADVLKLKPDGIFLANGPGDPEPCDYAIDATRELIETGIPTFGICLGHQIMALASGAKTFKMKFGHHGANHPVKDLDNGRVSITSQNHGFAVDEKTLPANLRATHVSLFDGTLQGLARTDKPAFCFQGHPEASPGPARHRLPVRPLHRH